MTNAYIQAAAAGDIATVAGILFSDFNIHIDTPNQHGVTALFAACQEGRTDLVSCLLKNFNFLYRSSSKSGKKGADPNKMLSLIDLENNNHQATALHIAAGKGRIRIVALLIEAGARVNRPASNGNRPLHLAARAGSLETVKLLIGKQAFPDLKNDAGRTAYDVAVLHGKKDVAEFLKDRSRFSSQNTDEQTGLQ